jgi:nitroreductase
MKTAKELHDYETLKNICCRRVSVRAYSKRQVADEDIERIKTIAATSPYASGRKNWDLIVVKNSSLIQDLAAAVKTRTNELARQVRPDFLESYLNYAQNFTFFEQAPLLLIPTFRVTPALSLLTGEPALTQWEQDNFTKSISCVTLLITLAAETLGLKTCYMTGPLLAEKELSTLLKIKTGHCIGAVVPVGYALGEKLF